MAAFEATDIYKHFGETIALNGVTITAEEGKIFGLLGPNGAGKTTLIRILSTLLEPDKGSVKVLGSDVVSHPDAVRRSIGLAGQFAAVDEYMTGRENIDMVGHLYHLPRRVIKERTAILLEQLALTEAADRTVKTYSGGMRRRLDLGASLIGRPKILYLDEPTTGLDPKTRLDLWQIIRELVSEGTSILLTTQYMEEADALADRIAVIDRGQVIAEGTSNQLKARLGGDIVEFQVSNARLQPKALQAVREIAKQPPVVDEDGLTISVPVEDGTKGLTEIVRRLDFYKIEPVTLALHRPSLDDVFLTFTGEKASAVATPSVQTGRRKGRRL